MKTLLTTALVTMLVTTPALADPDRVFIPLATHHTAPGSWEEVNPGLFLQWDNPTVDFTFGGFRNSFGGASVAAFISTPIVEWNGGSVDPFIGVAYYGEHARNFDYRLGEFVPLVGFSVRRDPFFVQAIPGKTDPLEMIFMFGMTWGI